MASSNVKLPDLIDKWIEVQKKRTDLERAKPLDIDAINLTLLLKSMGLRLQSLDFETEKSNTDNLTITVKCNRSGMRAELSYELLRCSCPEKNDQESSFWEVQATGPKVFSKFKNNTSSNLLPDVSESCALVSKAMLSNLLDFYETSIRQVKEEKQQAILHSPLKAPRPTVSVISPGLTIKTPFSTPPAEGKCSSRIETAPVKGDTVDVKVQHEAKEERPEQLSPNQPAAEERIETKSNTSSESVGINNKTHEILSSDVHQNKPVVDAILSSSHTSTADDHAYEVMKTLVTSSPNEKPPVVDTTGQHDRDQNVINYLQQARCQIDMALLLMQLNTTQDITHGSTHTLTPQRASIVSRKSLGVGVGFPAPKFAQQPRSSSLLSIERRRTPIDSGTGAKKTLSSTPSLTSTPRLSFGSTAGRPDTPRPSMAQVKSVAALRKVSSKPTTGGSSSLTAQPATGSLKKPATSSITSLAQSQRKMLPPSTSTGTGRTIPKPPTSGRPITPGGAGLIQRSSSALYIQKK
uniref:Uncharacterized protein n=1 Tax=Anopheles farauti TaxID=69004 RepID=A0A182QD13_9DIPT